jgi:hypothetical protein
LIYQVGTTPSCPRRSVDPVGKKNVLHAHRNYTVALVSFDLSAPSV